MGVDWIKFDSWCNDSDYSSDLKIIFNFVKNINNINNPIYCYDYLNFCHNFSKEFFIDLYKGYLPKNVDNFLKDPNEHFTKLLPIVITFFYKIYKPWLKNNEFISIDWNNFIKDIKCCFYSI